MLFRSDGRLSAFRTGSFATTEGAQWTVTDDDLVSGMEPEVVDAPQPVATAMRFELPGGDAHVWVDDTARAGADAARARALGFGGKLCIHPKQVAFFCHIPPTTDGETPIADVRVLQKRIPVDLFKAVQEKGILYTRSFRAPGQTIDAPQEHQLQMNAF